MTEITIVRAVRTCESHPSQWDAWTVRGKYLYLRYRFGKGTVDCYRSPDPETWAFPPTGMIACFDTDDEWDGEISLEDFCRLAGLGLELTSD